MFREDPELNNPIEIAKLYKIGIHTATQISITVKSPNIYSDSEGNLSAS
jgi:hypothetical protein